MENFMKRDHRKSCFLKGVAKSQIVVKLQLPSESCPPSQKRFLPRCENFIKLVKIKRSRVEMRHQVKVNCNRNGVEEVWDFKYENEVQFLVKWKNVSTRFFWIFKYFLFFFKLKVPYVTWESFEKVKNSSIFQKFIETLAKNYLIDIEINKDIYRKKLHHKAKEMKSKSPQLCQEILKKKAFDEFKFKTLQLLYHFIMPNREFEKVFTEMFILHEVNAGLNEQLQRYL